MVKIRNCTSDQFVGRVENSKLICICAGDNFKKFCEDYPLVPQIVCVVDNFKAGTVLQIGSRKIPVVSMEQIEQIPEETVLILTSVKVADEIIPQLDQSSIFQGKILYVPEIFKRDKTEFALKSGSVQIIPKIIHYCWFGDNPMPKSFQENIDTWKRHCADYEIKQWNERNYDISKNKYMLQAYENKKWGFVPDYARLDIVASQGGVYLDTDVKVVRSFDSLLQFGLFCGFESKTRINFGQGFGARKGHPIIKEMQKEYENMEFVNPDGTMNTDPSPIYQTRVLKRLGLTINGTLQQKDDVIVLSPEYFSPTNEFGYGRPTENTFSIHQYDGSWYDEEQRKMREKTAKNYQYIIGRAAGEK